MGWRATGDSLPGGRTLCGPEAELGSSSFLRRRDSPVGTNRVAGARPSRNSPNTTVYRRRSSTVQYLFYLVLFRFTADEGRDADKVFVVEWRHRHPRNTPGRSRTSQTQ